MWGNIEFIHAFTSEEEFWTELEANGLFVVCIQTDLTSIRSGAIRMKSLGTG